MKQQSWIILSLVFALIIAIFAVINVESVEVDFLFTTTDAPLILVILFSALLGALLVVGFSFSKIYQLQREIKDMKRENGKLEMNEPLNFEEIKNEDITSTEDEKEN